MGAPFHIPIIPFIASWGGLPEVSWKQVSLPRLPIQVLNQSDGEIITFQDCVDEERVRRASP
jgi:hypothetical protein